MVTINYFDYLSRELTEGIFCRLPLRGLIRLKSVSRSWLNLIDHLRLIGFVHTSSGLVVFLPIETFAYPNLHQVTLLTVKDHGNECAPDSSLIIHNIPWLIDSCNGLLLFAGEDDSSMRYHICSPITKKWVSLPLAHDFSWTASASLAFDGSNLNPNRNFIVMCIFWEESCACKNETANIKYLIFSSKTWEWIEDGSSLMLDSKFNPNEWFRPCLY
ncbi:F-box protein [Quillaja saponaria]|uniref:F-box protein n=1 Tax=Quillaja saponaria TaxID=32244 RepID=A0AAD7LGQ1_QUISA|nr:F-box protein [Quillaja saponaria]KAJ7957755.1 F-box protein [Quillaja saponaria]